ncbi:MFS transporter [Humibacter sp. BT305]|nr:MFS transporter [Humibacter sp. BT305]
MAATVVEQKPSLLRQPLAVWAVAFACVIAFMGIGLVDPILPAIAEGLDATQTQTSLLFTSYLVITGVAMLFTSWLSTRIGARRTLLFGLAMIVVFALAAGLSQNVESVIGFRAGWGLGNALFISTALATIVGAASGGPGSAIILYEAALGLGIAIGPLLGGLLGSVSWRGPFFGTAVLMAVAFIAIATLLKKDAETPPTPTPLSAPFRALRRPALATFAITALFYNIGFFILLAYTPYVLPLNEMGLGFTFFGWGVALAITSVWVAPWLTRRIPKTHVLWGALLLLAADLIAAGLSTGHTGALITCVVIGGLMLGVMNTVLTESVMEATDLPRQVASSSYSAVRFIGGAVAPPLASAIGGVMGASVPFYVAAGSVVVAALIVLLFRRYIRHVDHHEAPDRVAEAEAITQGEDL